VNLLLTLGVLVATTLPQQADSAASEAPAVHGVIRTVEEGRRVPLSYATVEIVEGGGRKRTVMTDAQGAYRIPDAAPGRRGLRARQLGYRSAEVDVVVPEGGSIEVDFLLRREPVSLPSLVIDVPGVAEVELGEGTARPSGLGPVQVELGALEASPGMVEAGLGDAVRSIPGNDPSDPTDVLLMRGSTADLKLVLLDGAPVYTPFHTGGLLQSFDVTTLGGAAHHMGGAPARYDGGLSYILDLRTRPARRDELRASGRLDLMSAQTGIESPLGERAGILASGRALHDGAGRLAGGDRSPYGYVEGLTRVDVDAGAERHLSVTGFVNRERVRLDIPESSGRPRIDRASWGNDALAAAWRSPLGPGTLEVTLARSSYRAELPIRALEGIETPSADGAVYLATGRTDRTRFAAELSLPGLAHGLRLGLSADRTGASYGTHPPEESGTLVRATGSTLGAYADGTRPLTADLLLRYGARLDRFVPGGVKGALRMALLWNLGPEAVLSIAAGRYHQLARPGEAEADLAVGNALDVGTAVVETGSNNVMPLLRVATADHLTVALDQEVTSDVRLGFEGFLKRFRNLTPATERELASSGADLRIARETQTSTAWLGYSLAWFWETGVTNPDFSGQQLLSAGLQRPLAGPVGLDLRVSFSDGLPLTAVALQREQSPLGYAPSVGEGESDTSLPSHADGFLRLDVEIYAQWTRALGGRKTTIRPYVRILNALDRRDALFYYFDSWRGDGLRPLADLPLVPVVGFGWRF
jgi:hypothetical protein